MLRATLPRKGLLGIIVGYRLAPEARYPDGSLDVSAAVAWARSHGPDYGGDPERIFLVGHSAGGTHVAPYVAHPRARPAEGHGVRGIVLLSGRAANRSMGQSQRIRCPRLLR